MDAATWIFLVIAAGVGLFLWKRHQENAERAPPAMMNRVLGQASKPNIEIQQHDQTFARTWAKEVLEIADEVAIIDTETTGLKENDEVLSIAVIDGNGKILLDTLVNPPTRKRWPKAQAIHGITPSMVRDAPKFSDVYQKLQECLGQRRPVFYNANFDARLLRQTALKAGLPFLEGDAECAMIQYSLYRCEWDNYHRHYRWHKLPSAEHNALGDCQATLKLIREMASE